MEYGPKLEISKRLHAQKYRGVNEDFEESMSRIASTLSDDETHRKRMRDILLDMRFMPGGRIQAAVGATRKTTPYNCFVSGLVGDSMKDIMAKCAEAAETMRQGGGIGFDFSTLRPRGDLIESLQTFSTGPVTFLGIPDAICETVRSAGHRRGAMMGVMRVDHPDIEEFVRAKQNSNRLTNFNLSVGITDEFMLAVKLGTDFPLRFNGKVYKRVNARALWDLIMRGTWDWAEPGVLFLDTINRLNNLWYCEHIAASNPCAEQPLPPYGACLLGSINLTRYVRSGEINLAQLDEDIHQIIPAMDNVIDVATYPLPQQEQEAKSKRRMGIGITGLANALEITGRPYGSLSFVAETARIMHHIRDHAYKASIDLAKRKGPFKLFIPNLYGEGKFIKSLPDDIQADIRNFGIRNSHLLSIAPTGTISFCADNISSGIEPVYAHEVNRTMLTELGSEIVQVKDYAFREYGIKGRVADSLTVDEHVNVLLTVAKYVDSAVSKTLNVGDNVSFDEFKSIYMRAYDGGAKGCTTFRASGKRFGIIQKVEEETEGAACYYNPETGTKTCE